VPIDHTHMTTQHALLPPGLIHQHQTGWTCIADPLATELTGDPDPLGEARPPRAGS